MPTVLLVMVAATGLATTAVISSVGAQSGTVRDQNSKAALAVAEAGVSNALLRYNRIATTSAADACAPVGSALPPVAGWCTTPVTGTIDRGTFSYRVKPTPAVDSTPGQITVVSTGTVDGTSRTVKAVSDTIAEGYKPFGDASVIGLDWIHLNSRANITADVATNGNIGLDSNAALNCDYAQVGVGRGYSPMRSNSTASCSPVQDSIALPPVNPGDVSLSNSNARICSLDPIQGQSCASAWNATTRTLQLNSGSSITLGAAGGEFNYAFCKILLNSNSYLHIANGADVRIYFLSPDSPPCTNQSEPLQLNSNSKIQPTGDDAKLAILVVGSDVRTTRITLNSNAILFDCDQSFVLYAPRTELTINSNTHICGATAAKNILVNSNSSVTASSTAGDFELPGEDMAAHYGPPRDFIECSAVPAATGAPDSGC